MSSTQSSSTASVPSRSDPTNAQKALEEDGYMPKNTTLAIFPNGRPTEVHFAFITLNPSWTYSEMTQALLRAASASHGSRTGGYTAIKSLRVATGPMWQQEGFECLDPVVEEGNFKEVLSVLKERPGRCVLIADM
ncbi:MAG: hypothetical protein HETSPECPRED_002853 [Heterodermia speciosa]|uniref:Uncharacterized protein n=1 Tax=Heterodermia speciosa TaxID=116794 RepID=A0A8H3PGX7_9LECA|nr:MAG: hypothetical protein HETSPECPRED_002853 [Heterodermia speciosa]